LQHGEQPPKGFVGAPPAYMDDIPPAAEDECCGHGLPEFSDDALALMFTATHAGALRYVAALSKWLLWADSRWGFEETLRAFDLARAICRQASARVPPNMTRLAAAVASAKTVAAVERLAKADRRHAATVEQWDADDWIFNKQKD
jgi:putative DNA primase/helicase